MQMEKKIFIFIACYFEINFLCELLIMKARRKNMLLIYSYKCMWITVFQFFFPILCYLSQIIQNLSLPYKLHLFV